MPFAEDLAPFFAVDEFADLVAFNGGASVRAIFDNGTVPQLVGDLVLDSTGPQLTIADASLPSPVLGASVVVRSVTYTVRAHEPDGTGISVLRLTESA